MSTAPRVLLPGATIGVLGAGQLARMLALDARRMGYRVRALGTEADGPAGQVCDEVVVAAPDDVDAACTFAAGCDVVTLDTEHIPADVLDAVDRLVPVRPSPRVLRTVQDRLVQRRFLADLGVPQPRFADLVGAADLGEVVSAVGLPCVRKTRHAGYDGKGQARAYTPEALAADRASLKNTPALVEELLSLACEVSVMLARGLDGQMAFWPVLYNTHCYHVLHTTVSPAPVPDALTSQALEIAATIATAFDYVGTMAVEFFVTTSGQLLVNEIAPRTHNSGHLTLGACVTSQFEQHVRAICGLPLGDPSQHTPAVLVNLLGADGTPSSPTWRVLLDHPGAKLHLYGKAQAVPGRKMGHVLILDRNLEDALALVARVFPE